MNIGTPHDVISNIFLRDSYLSLAHWTATLTALTDSINPFLDQISLPNLGQLEIPRPIWDTQRSRIPEFCLMGSAFSHPLAKDTPIFTGIESKWGQAMQGIFSSHVQVVSESEHKVDLFIFGLTREGRWFFGKTLCKFTGRYSRLGYFIEIKVVSVTGQMCTSEDFTSLISAEVQWTRGMSLLVRTIFRYFYEWRKSKEDLLEKVSKAEKLLETSGRSLCNIYCK